MKKILYLCSIATIALCVSGCKKETPNDETTSTTTTTTTNETIASIKVVNTSNTGESGSTVYLYSSENDLLNSKNVKYYGTTNSEGIASIKISNPGTYYILATKDCRYNLSSSPVSGGGIKYTTYSIAAAAGKTSKKTVTLKGFGTLKLNCTSDHPYAVYVDNVKIGQIAGNSKIDVLLEAKSYKIRVLQLSGYAFYPTEREYTRNLSCGGTQTCTFPN